MFSDDQRQTVKPRLLLIQWLAAAMLAGVLVFAGLISLIVDWENLNEHLKMLNLFAGGTGIFLFMLSVVIPRMLSMQPHRDRLDANPDLLPELAGALTVENILRFALLDGGIFLNLVVFMIEPHIVSVIVAAIGILLMLVFFPRQSTMISVIQRQISQSPPGK